MQENSAKTREKSLEWFKNQFEEEFCEPSPVKSSDVSARRLSKNLVNTINESFAEEDNKSDDSGGLTDSDIDSSFQSDEEFDIYDLSQTNEIARKLDPAKERQILKTLNIKYIYGFLRILRTFVYLILILITVIGISFKSNMYSIFSLIALIPMIFRKFNYKAMKMYNLFLLILLLFEY